MTQLELGPSLVSGAPVSSMSIRTLTVICAIVFSVSHCNISNADMIFGFSNSTPSLTDGLDSGDSMTVGGVTLTFSNVVVADGSSSGDVESAGILLSSTNDVSLSDVISFDFSFSHDVQISDYSIGLHEDVPASSFFTISGVNGTSGNNSIPEGTLFVEQTFGFDAGTIPVFLSGQSYSFTHNLPADGDPLFDLGGFTVTSVPEPGSAGLVALSVLGLVVRRRRK